MKDLIHSTLEEMLARLDERKATIDAARERSEAQLADAKRQIRDLFALAEKTPSSALLDMGTPAMGEVELWQANERDVQLRVGGQWFSFYGLYNRGLDAGRYRVLLFFQKRD